MEKRICIQDSETKQWRPVNFEPDIFFALCEWNEELEKWIPIEFFNVNE